MNRDQKITWILQSSIDLREDPLMSRRELEKLDDERLEVVRSLYEENLHYDLISRRFK